MRISDCSSDVCSSDLTFTMSFFLLGLLTSLPELVIGLTSIVDGQPEIFVGNLIGGTIILFLLVIPLLALTSQGIKATRPLRSEARRGGKECVSTCRSRWSRNN